MTVEIGAERTISSVSVLPDHPGIEGIVGARGGGGMRSIIDDALPGEREAATPLYFLLDDIAGATLVAGFAWSRTRPMQPEPGRRDAPTRMRSDGRIICSGLRPGGYYEERRKVSTAMPHFLRLAGDLSAPDDPWAWHDIEPAPEVCFRRRRRIDAWCVGSAIEVDAHFRDSLWDPDHVELAVHEYSVVATIDAASHALVALDAIPRVLPFPECPWAAPHASSLAGMAVDGFRAKVQDALTELRCCTHLNDTLRGLAEVPALVAALEHETARA
jgi:hypothetical protein